jgi:putative ABC transport system permease protein
MSALLQDLRYAIRQLRKSPGFAAVAVLTLALGIGANTAIFGLVDSAILHALPFREPERLVNIWTTDSSGDLHTPFPAQYSALRANSQSFEQVAGMGWGETFYGDDESGRRNLPTLLVSSNWLATLGIQPLLGRNFQDDEQTIGRDSVVALSYRCWRERFHADRNIVGREIILNRRPVTVVGVLPQSLGVYYQNIDVFRPLVLDSYIANGTLRVAGAVRLRIVARLKEGVTLDRARSEAAGIAAGVKNPAAQVDRSGQLVVEDFGEALRNPGPTMQNARHALEILGVAALVVLLIGSANLASLQLARGLKRQREIAVRSALGCSRAGLIRQLLTESTLLSLCGGALGIFAARWSQEIINKAASGIVFNAAYLHVNVRVFVAGLGFSFLSVLLFGAIPSIHATSTNLSDSLKDATLAATAGSQSRRLRNLSLVFQTALCMVLLVCFGLLFRSLLHVRSAELGFDPDNVLTASVSLPASRYAAAAERVRLLHDSIQRVQSLPGVVSAGTVDSLPMDGAESAQLRIEPLTPGAPPIEKEIYFVSVSPGYFSTLQIPMLAGRPFLEQDSPTSAPVAIVNRVFANTYFSRVSPIGHHLAFADLPGTQREIVGVVSDFRQRNPEEDLRPLVYFPIVQTAPQGHWSLVLRVHSASDLGKVASELNKSLQSMDLQLFWEVGSMQKQIDDSESLTLRRPVIFLLSSFAAVALILAVIGVFGVTSYSISERTKEIGIRVVLGAARREIAVLIFRESLQVTFAGLAVGALVALSLSRILPTDQIGWSGSGIFLYHVSRTDPLTYLSAAVVLTVIALGASWLPARHATRVDPNVALRYE